MAALVSFFFRFFRFFREKIRNFPYETSAEPWLCGRSRLRHVARNISWPGGVCCWRATPISTWKNCTKRVQITLALSCNAIFMNFRWSLGLCSDSSCAPRPRLLAPQLSAAACANATRSSQSESGPSHCGPSVLCVLRPDSEPARLDRTLRRTRARADLSCLAAK